MESFHHVAWLSIYSLVLLASFMLRVKGTDHVEFSYVMLPELCNLKRFTGIECPGCGLTRSFICMAHGEWYAAWKFHAAGPIWFIAVVAQVPYRIWQLLRLKRGKMEFRTGMEVPLLVAMFVLIVVVWLNKILLS